MATRRPGERGQLRGGEHPTGQAHPRQGAVGRLVHLQRTGHWSRSRALLTRLPYGRYASCLTIRGKQNLACGRYEG
ncbi:hypothetical protein I552_4215 [Mycobacterium xenopi 3993]|nr:hypothetical protein I552_4215 [Mycobacterium xenopi 3993]